MIDLTKRHRFPGDKEDVDIDHEDTEDDDEEHEDIIDEEAFNSDDNCAVG